MITVLPTREDLSKEEQEFLNTCKINQSVYLTDKPMEEVKSYLYGELGEIHLNLFFPE